MPYFSFLQFPMLYDVKHQHANLVDCFQSKALQTRGDQLKSQIEYCDDKINKLIYHLYGLTEEEM
jgi:hypothetical protein